MDTGWEHKPYLHRVFLRSGGLFDYSPEYKKERVFWTKPLKEIAEALDELHASAEAMPEEARFLELALDTFIVLVDPDWWREHSPREVTKAEDRRLIRLLDRSHSQSRGSTPGQAMAGREASRRSLESLITAAAETFVRARDPQGLEGCARLMRAILWRWMGRGREHR